MLSRPESGLDSTKHLTILLVRGFRILYNMVARWICRNSWGSLFLNLPVEFEPYINAYRHNEIDEDSLWRSYSLLTGLSDPFVNSVKLRFQPIFENLQHVSSLKDRQIYCYTDVQAEVESKNITETLLLLEFRYHATGRFELENWRKLLLHEYNTLKDFGERMFERILEGTEIHPSNLILFTGYLNAVERFTQHNTQVKVVLLDTYWKSPLDILRTIIWKHGLEKTSDETIEFYLRLQKKYITYILQYQDIDKAHEAWTRTIHRRLKVQHNSPLL